MAKRFRQPYAERRRRLMLIAAAALLIVSVVVILLAVLWPCDGEEPAPRSGDSGAPTEVADGALPDGAPAPADLAPDHKARPHGTRRITDRELRALLRRHGGMINACYTLAARRAVGTTPSRVFVTVTLGDRGRVRNVAVAAGNASRLSGCLSRSIRGWRFSPGLRAQQVSFPIVRPR